MISKYDYLPVLELTRGEAIESVHYGSFAIVNSLGEIVSSYGDPDTITFLRSSAKPFQALPFIENKGHTHWQFSKREIAIMCASHTGTDEHMNVLLSMQAKIHVTQDDLLCGVHPPTDTKTNQALHLRGEAPTPNRHNCSGKHTGMLAYAKLLNAATENYIDLDHPVQKMIVKTFHEMCNVKENEIAFGIDGCSAPVFGIPLQKAAYGFARFCDPRHIPDHRATACRAITDAMMTYPEMVSGPGMFDTRLMEATRGKIVSKGGAEGYQLIGIMQGVLAPKSPGLGIALKISDGDLKNRTRPAVAIEILHQLGAISSSELETLSDFGPKFPVQNWRNVIVGEAYPVFSLAIKSHSK